MELQKDMPEWLAKAYSVDIPEVNLTDKVEMHRIFGADRQWPDHWTVRGQTAGEHPSVRDNPPLKSIPEYAAFVAGNERPRRPEPGERGGGYWPVMIRLNDPKTGKESDSLACLFRTGAIHVGPGGNIAVAFSDDRGRTWSEPKIVVPYDANLKFDYRHGSLGQAHNGDLLVIDWVSEAWTHELKKTILPDFIDCRLWRSGDMGGTWNGPRSLGLKDKLGFGVGSYGPILRVGESTLVVNVREGETDRSYLAWSHDDGLTWPEITTISTDRITETWVLPLDETEWVGYARQGAGGAWITRSHDGGQTWPDWREIEPYRRRVPGCIVRLPGNQTAVIHTYRQHPFGIRAFLSHDGGKTFQTDLSYVLCDSFWMEDCGYPSAVVFDDGTVVVAAYATKLRGRPEWGTSAVALVFHASVFERDESR
ncbi:MAG: exo-alpha-sialidase [Phycisphaerae bacterium]|nr:exo-alpha-sialidase [Phycisphaerae bacterium]